MGHAEDFAEKPRTHFGMARRSVWNISFPESDAGEQALRFIKFGRVALDVHKRIPPDRLASFSAEQERGSGGEIESFRFRNLLIDAEAVIFHWAADNLADGRQDISPEMERSIAGLADILEYAGGLSRSEKNILRTIIDSTSPLIREGLWATDELDPLMLRACLVKPRLGRSRHADPITAAATDGLLDDWRRRVGTPITQATSAGSPRHFFNSAFEFMSEFPPKAEDCAVRARVAIEAEKLNRIFDGPLERALKREAERNSAGMTA